MQEAAAPHADGRAARGPDIEVCAAALAAMGLFLQVVAACVAPGAGAWLALGVFAAAVLGPAIPGLRGPLLRWLTSTPFAASQLALLLVATMLGTFLHREATPEAFAARYGAWAPLLRAAGLDDVFHSVWYQGWLGLLAAALVLVVIRRRAWRPPQWGHALAHLGVVLILAAGLVGDRWGFKGRLDLHEGQAADAAVTTTPGGSTPSLQPLGFAVRLDKFDMDYYPPDYRFYVYERLKDGNFRPRKSIKRKTAAAWTSLGASGAEFRVEREIPADRRPAEAHVLVVERGAAAPEEVPVRPEGTFATADGAWRFRILGYYPDFVIDAETRVPASRSSHPNNPALQVEVVAASGEPRRRWLFARAPGFDHEDNPETDQGLRLTYRYLPAVVPAQVEIELRAGGSVVTHRFPAEGGGEPLRLPDGKSALTYELRTDVKAYRSRLSILEGERQVLEKTIRVNDPLAFGGFMLYQANYRKEDPTYSGIQVVRDPGLSLAWLGLIALCAGVVFIYYIRPRWTGRNAGVTAALGVDPGGRGPEAGVRLGDPPPGVSFWTPEALAVRAYRIAAFGVVVLTFGLVMGAVWAKYAWGDYWTWDSKENWSLVTWLAYMVYLHLRLAPGWQGRRAVWLLVVAFGAVLFTWLGMHLLPESQDSLHVYQDEPSDSMGLEAIKDHLLVAVNAALYGLTLLVSAAALLIRRDGWRRAALALLAAAFLVGTGVIAARWIDAGRPPFKTRFETLLLYPWCVAAVTLVIYKLHRLFVLIPFSAACCLFCLYKGLSNPDLEAVLLMPALQSVWFVPHVVTYFYAYAALFVSCALAGLVLAAPLWHWQRISGAR
jgi:ABC-type transport system involved in cytochrome c biogenesis permease subunit